MAVYVCAQLSTPDINGYQNCISWTEQNTSVFNPDNYAITAHEAELICGSIAVLFAVAFVFAKLRSIF